MCPVNSPTRRRAFTLFEIVLSFALLSLCLIPLLRPQIAWHQALREELNQLEEERVERAAFATVREELYRLSIPYKHLEKKHERPFFFEGEQKMVHFQGSQINHVKKPSCGRIGSLFEIRVQVVGSKKDFVHTLFVQRMNE